MTKQSKIPKPLFDTLTNIDEPIIACVLSYINSLGISDALKEYELAKEFLCNYGGSNDTFNTYRREVERLLQWSWLIAKLPIHDLDRNHLRHYFEFIQSPPREWLSNKNVARFTMNEMGERVTNPSWRPFVYRISKARRYHGETPDPDHHQLSPKSLQSCFASLSTFYTYMQQEGYVDVNPVSLIRQKSRLIQKHQTQKVTRKLSHLQWQTVIETTAKLAEKNDRYERNLFVLSAFYLLGLRISEMAETPDRIPVMGHFAPDKHDRWWFTTVGKGNKQRDVAVPDAMLEALKRYRKSLSLPPLPSRGEQTPLLHRERGKGGLGTRQVRKIVQFCFDCAILQLEQAGHSDAAEDLRTATVHWLRHTAISADVAERPREHVRDDAGHGSAHTTDQYIDADRIERHNSAKNKKLNPEYKSPYPVTQT